MFQAFPEIERARASFRHLFSEIQSKFSRVLQGYYKKITSGCDRTKNLVSNVELYSLFGIA
jgi:hypothetical protein